MTTDARQSAITAGAIQSLPARCLPGGRRDMRQAFTLIELMISIALVLFLILGVNQVFEYTTKAVGAGEAINSAIRGSRAVQTQLAQDFGAIVSPGTGPTDSACLIINSQQAYAYRNKADLAAEGTLNSPVPFIGGTYPPGAPYQDFDNNGKFGDPNVPGEVTYPYTYNARNHRLDVLSFFARDLFHRQTGNPGTYVDNMSSQEAWIWYGHLWLPNNSADPTPTLRYTSKTFPCAGLSPSDNPNNFFASSLVLGRMAMLLVPQTGAAITDPSGTTQWFIAQNFITPPTELTPLEYFSNVNQSGAPSTVSDPISVPTYLFNSRLDLASTSISTFRQKLLSYLSNPPNAGNPWWDYLMNGTYTYGGRFQCDPFVAKPMSAVDMAHASPYFLGGCSQFIVEFAGDYQTQDNDPSSVTYGFFTGVGQDKQVDYVRVTDLATGLVRKQIIWYGMPRNTSGISTGNGMMKYNATHLPNTPSFAMPNGDVAPVAVWTNLVQSFEHTLPVSGAVTTGSPYSVNPNSMANGDKYTCAWGPNDTKPSLIRITLTIEDPTGRLPDGQTYQYVFSVP